MSTMTVDEIAAGLVRQFPNISPELARKKAEQIAGIPTAREARPVIEQLIMPTIPWPFQIRLPWSALCSDNDKYGAIVIDGKPRLILTEKYKAAKKVIRGHAEAILGHEVHEPANYPLSLVAAVWVPDEMRAHDVPNFAKCCHDALEKVVYTKDRWLYDARWHRVGVDVDAPRAELTITPIPLR